MLIDMLNQTGQLHSCPSRRSSDLSTTNMMMRSTRPSLMEIPAASEAMPVAKGLIVEAVTSRAETSPRMRLGFPSARDRKSTRLNSSHVANSYAVCCLKIKKYHQHH